MARRYFLRMLGCISKEERTLADDKLLLFSEAWLNKYQDLLNASKEYADAAKTWESDMIFEIAADGDAVKTPMRVHMDLWHGKLRGWKIAGPDDDAAYVYSGLLKNWKRLFAGELGPIKGLMSGHFKLKGSLATVMRYLKAAQELVKTATMVPTRYPDE